MAENINTVKIAGTEVVIRDFSKLNENTIIKTFLNFIDVGNTATGRATFYNTKDEQNTVIENSHRNMLGIDRGIYAATMMLDGINDINKMVGVRNLLLTKDNRDHSMISLETETKIIACLMTQLPVQRLLKMYGDLKEKRVNNARTRRIILLSILNSSSLEYWSVKYRAKMKNALEHAWGKRMTSIIASILKRKSKDWNAKELTIITTNVRKYANHEANEKVEECVSFILGNEKNITLPILTSFVEAKTDLSKGTKLPTEVLEGIRSTYHKGVKKEKILELTKENLTEKEKMKVQTRAANAGIAIKFDPSKQDVVDLYIYAYERGMDDEIASALKEKAKSAAKNSPLSYGKVGIVFDASCSSKGDKTQNLRPLAVSSSIRDLLIATSKEYSLEIVGGFVKNRLIYPEGETNIAKALVKVLKEQPDAIFILSDGYENAPAGRTNEVINAIREMGIETPVYHINPVAALETASVRKLSDQIAVIPANKPSALGLGMVKAMLETNLKDGILGLFNITLPKLKR
jgi:hypothetical protein